MQTFLPYPDLAASCRVLDDRRLGKQRVETFQVLRALTWADYGWKNHPVTKMWRGFVPGLVAYGLASCREWTARGYADALAPQLLAWTGGRAPVDPELPPWLGVEPVHRSHRSNLLRKDPELYRPWFPDEPDDLPYVWPEPAFPHWPLRPGLGLAPYPWQAEAVAALLDGRDVLLVAPRGSGASTVGLLAGQQLGRTVVVQPPLGPPAGPVPELPPPVGVPRVSRPATTVARVPSAADLVAMAAEAHLPRFVFRRAPEPGDLLVLDRVPGRGVKGTPTLRISASDVADAGLRRPLTVRAVA